MNLTDHFPPRDDGRKAELDPSTFDHAEDWQIEADAKAVFWLLRGGFAFIVVCLAIGLWALWTLAKAVL